MLGTTIILAIREIRRHLLRSFLTILGIVIGVSAVVTMVTLGNGATAAVQEQISRLGANIMQIRQGQGFGRGGGGPRPPRTEENTSELQSLRRSSYTVFCLKKNIPKKKTRNKQTDKSH